MLSTRSVLAFGLVFALGCSSSDSTPLPDVSPSDNGKTSKETHDAGASEGDGDLRWGPGTQLDADLSWEGFAKGSDAVSTIRLGDFHDPDGSKGIHALLLTQESLTCDFSFDAAEEIRKRAPGWADDGIEVIQLVVYDAKDEPATVETARQWKDFFEATWNVGADPAFTFHEIGHNPLPIQLVVDPRTLTVVARANANDHRLLNELENLAEQNRP